MPIWRTLGYDQVDRVPNTLIVRVSQYCEDHQTVQGIVIIVHWKMERCGEWQAVLPVMMVTLVDSVHQQEFCSLLRGPFHLTRPPCTWNLCVGPERFDC